MPHLPRLPLWVAAVWLVCAGWRIQIQRMRWGYPGILVQALALVGVVAGVWAAQGSLIGLDSAVMLLLLLFMLKLLEMRKPRDTLVVIYLGFFTVATAFLFDQGRPMALFQCFSLLILVAALVGLQGSLIGLASIVTLFLLLFMLKQLWLRKPRDALVVIYLGFFIVATAFLFDQGIPLALFQCFAPLIPVVALVGLQQTPARSDPARAMRTAAVLLLQALPLMLVLFMVFPRLGPLWAVNAPGSQARTGLAESMSPADVADLARSGELAFRASFEGAPPPQPLLYWRAMTLARFDGRNWSRLPLSAGQAHGNWQPEGEPVRYQVIVPPSHQPWVFSLRGAQTVDERLVLNRDFLLQARRPISQTMAYSASSQLDSLLEPAGLEPLQRRLHLQLPEGFDPRARAFAAEQ